MNKESFESNLHVPSVCFCGYSGSGKTTLAERFVHSLTEQGYRCGFLKHAGHKHAFDQPQKDTNRAGKAGSKISAIFSDHHFALFGKQAFTPQTLYSARPVIDMIVAEGFKNSPNFLHKVSVEHPQKGFADINEPVCRIFRNPPTARQSGGIEFGIDDTENINRFLLDYIINATRRNVPLNAAILIGGLSTRMNTDKHLLNYHGVPEFERLYHLLKQCPDVNQVRFFGRGEQKGQHPLIDQNITEDRFIGFGPHSGILTALHHYNSAVLVIGCDYPGLSLKTIERLIQNRDPLKCAALFLKQGGKIETTCGIYEPVMRHYIHARIAETGNMSNYEIKRISPKFIHVTDTEDVELSSVNTHKEKQNFLTKNTDRE